jgi:hypothetical protein
MLLTAEMLKITFFALLASIVDALHVRGAINLDSASWPKIIGKETHVLVKFDKVVRQCVLNHFEQLSHPTIVSHAGARRGRQREAVRRGALLPILPAKPLSTHRRSHPAVKPQLCDSVASSSGILIGVVGVREYGNRLNQDLADR